MMNGWNDWGGSGRWLPMTVVMLVFWGGLVWIVVILARQGDRGFQRRLVEPSLALSTRPVAQDILRRIVRPR